MLELADAEFFPGAETVGDDGIGHVVRSYADGRQGNEGDVICAVIQGQSTGQATEVLTLEQSDGGLGCREGLGLDRLINRHGLVAGQHMLDAAYCGVLAGDWNAGVAGIDAGALEGRDDRIGQAVIGGEDAGDVAFRRGQDLLEDNQGLLVVPVGYPLVVDQLPGAVVEVRLGVANVAFTEQRRVVVRRAAIEQHNLGRTILGADQRFQNLAHGRTDLDVVEADVDVGAWTFDGQAVVVNHSHAGVTGLGDDGRARAGVQVDQQDDLGPGSDGLLGLGLLGAGVAFGVDDVVLDSGCLKGLREETAIVGLPTSGAGAVGQQYPNAAFLFHGFLFHGFLFGRLFLGFSLGFSRRLFRLCRLFFRAVTGGQDGNHENGDDQDRPPPQIYVQHFLLLAFVYGGR